MALDSNIIANRARAEKAAKDAVKGEGINPAYVSNVVDTDPIDYVEGTGVPYGQKTTSDDLIQRLVWNDITEVWDDLGDPFPNKTYVDDEISAKIALEKAILQAEIDADVLVEKNRAEVAEANLQTQVDAIEDAQLTGLIAVGTKSELDAITDKDDLTPGRVDSDTDYSFTFTDADITAGSDTIGETAVSLSDNDVIIIFIVSGTLDSALTAFENYYVVSKATDSIKLSLTPGGPAIDLQGDGSGTYTLVKTNNGDYRWDDGNSYWIKKRGVYSEVLNPNGVVKAPTEKAVAEFIFETDARVLEMYSSGAFNLTNPTLSGHGNLETADLVWADGVLGSVSNLIEDSEGRVTSIRYNRQAGKYITITIDYSSELPLSTKTTTGY